MSSILNKYAQLLVNYCVSLKEGERVLIQSTTLAEPLVREVYREALISGALPHVSMDFRDQRNIRLKESSEQQLAYVNPLYAMAMEDFDAYIFIRAPFYSRSTQPKYSAKAKLEAEARKPYRTRYAERTATLELKRTLCEYPTVAHAQNAGLSFEQYAEFIYNACHLYDDNPQACWEEVSRNQQKAVDLLNSRTKMRYLGEGIDISFSTEGRTWINSDGKTNMPSGEVYTAPVDDSVNGTIHFAYPSMFMGEEVEGITLWVKDGWVDKWEAKKGKKLLDTIFNIDDGARRFGEAAIGTNMRIQTPVKNILFDEKIGGTVHMAVGQAYIQNGGLNKSAIHWDMIADMKNGGQIFADNELIYESGKFIF
ncbi:MAG: aminopeptidase [Saprospiraceae bacterium]|nr:aminopeptidase [Saprospiraceae bacterium]